MVQGPYRALAALDGAVTVQVSIWDNNRIALQISKHAANDNACEGQNFIRLNLTYLYI